MARLNAIPRTDIFIIGLEIDALLSLSKSIRLAIKNSVFKIDHLLQTIKNANLACSLNKSINMLKNVLFFLVVNYVSISCGQKTEMNNPIITGAEQTGVYMNLLSGKNVALICNHTSLVLNTHLVDTLLASGINIKKIFSPEHGFRGIHDAGKEISDTIDKLTAIPIVSLYGEKKKPSSQDLSGIDFLIFDIQDVGVRFYTYISTLHYIMESGAENNVPLLVLDRPNPNGYYVDGPVLMKKYSSFVGLHPVPVVHGMTIGEYAMMINGEGWLKEGKKCELRVITCVNYTHSDRFQLQINPSPNLRNMRGTYLYPALGLFEGTVMSIGRGTDFPFQVIGHPDYPGKTFSFTPKSVPGAENPKYLNKKCFGIDLTSLNTDSLSLKNNFDLSWIIKPYEVMKLNEKFFNNYFNYLAGNNQLKQQIIEKKSIVDIRNSWKDELDEFKKIRLKYLLYPDF